MTERIGRFEILLKIGEGGMGTVYKARDPQINRVVAIKLLREGFDNDEMRERFMREAQAAGGLQNPHVVTIFELGEHQGAPFIVMEFVVGEPLDGVIRRRLPLSPTRKLELMEALCSGLATAHHAGVIHRDIKPQNLMVIPDGLLKILDFGIARVSTSEMTKAGMLIGTPSYMSPEQLSSAAGVDSRTDIFSVGAVFYELLTYERAFAGATHTEVIARVLTSEPVPLRTMVPGLDPSVALVVEKALKKHPSDRYQDLSEMRRQLFAIRQRLERKAPQTLVDSASGFTISASAGVQAALTDSEAGEQRAFTAIEAAHELYDRGEIAAALERLQGFTPGHPLVADALAALRDRADENQRRQQRALALVRALEAANEAFNRGDFDASVHAANDALLIDERSVDAREIRQRARTALDEQRQRVHGADREGAATVIVGQPAAARETSLAAPKSSVITGTRLAVAALVAAIAMVALYVAMRPTPAPEVLRTASTPSAAAPLAVTTTTSPLPTAAPAPPVAPLRGGATKAEPPAARSGNAAPPPPGERVAPREPTVTSEALTTIPAAAPLPTISVAPTTIAATTSVQSTTSVPLTTSIAPPAAAPTLTVEAAQAIVDQYAAAYRGFSLDAIRRIFPDFSSTDQQRLARQRQAFAYCEYRFSAPSVTFSSPDAARFEADGVEACKPKTAQPPMTLPAHHIFDLRRGSSGWVIARHAF